MRNEVDHCYFPRKSRYSRQYPARNNSTFLTLLLEKANPIGMADFRRRKTKDSGMFFFWFKAETIMYPHLRITKISENKDKFLFSRNQTNICLHRIQLNSWEWIFFSRTSSPFFPSNSLFFFRCIEFFIWSDIGIGSLWCHFHFTMTPFLDYRFYVTVSGVPCRPRFCRGCCQVGYLVPYELRTSSLKLKDFCFYRLPT